MSTPFTDSDSGRDPFAIAIESLLCEMQAKCLGAIRKTSTPDSIILCFGELKAEGKTLDIALVRLASAMMDDEKYTPLLIEALKPVRSAAA